MKSFRLYIGHSFVNPLTGNTNSHTGHVVEFTVNCALRDVGLGQEGRTLYVGKGVWEGVEEATTIVEFITSKELYMDLKKAARQIAQDLNQQCVLVVGESLAVDFVKATFEPEG